MIGWFRRTAADPKELFPIENLPAERYGEGRSDALALIYRRPQKGNQERTAQLLPANLNLDKEKESFFRRILPILDGFDTIFRYAQRTNVEDDETLSNWLKTLETLYRRLFSALEKEGLSAIESKGKLLDLTVHEVVDTREEPDVPENTIVEEIVKGYQFGRRILRDAKVIVAKKTKSH